jgi:hypothetical protein
MGVIDQYALVAGFDTEWVNSSRVPDLPPGMYGRQCDKCAAKGPTNIALCKFATGTAASPPPTGS